MKRISIIGKLFLSLLLALQLSCVSQLENPLNLEPQLVISGQFSNSPGSRVIRVLSVEGLDGKGTQLEASGSIYKDGQVFAELEVNEDGDLELPANFVVEEGAAYFAEVITNGNNVYRSEPQVVQPKLETESISFEFEEDIESSRFLGLTVNRSRIEFFAHVNLPDPQVEKRYYRWVVDEAWNYIESNQDDTCYLANTIFDNTSSLVTNASGLLQNGEARVSILDKRLDNTFAHTHFINVYLHSLDAKTFEFYEKSQRLTSGTGTIYDEVPGPFRGNLSNVADAEEVVLGWVEFFLADTLRYRVRRDEINTSVPTQCDDIPGGGPCPPQIPPPGGGLPPPCQCNACAAVLGQDALNPPDYWVD